MGATMNRLIFQAPQPTYSEDPNLIWVTTKTGSKIPSFFINRGAKLTLLFSHGNAEDLGMIVNYFREVSATWRVNVFAYEYTGYGLSEGGSARESQVFADAEAAYEYLTTKLEVKANSVVCYGRSLGSGAACHIALKHRNSVRGLILQSPLMSIHRVAINLRFSLPGDLFCNIDKIGKILCPTFIVHGTRDEVIPVSHGMELYKRCKTSVTPYWVEGGGHNDLETTGRHLFFENFARFLRFLESECTSMESLHNKRHSVKSDSHLSSNQLTSAEAV